MTSVAQNPRRRLFRGKAAIRWRAALLGTAVLVLPAVASSETGPTIEAENKPGGSHAWSPTQASVSAGGAVTISNPTAVNHGVEWKAGPTTPNCSAGVPVGTSPSASGTKWSGTCVFAQPGTYIFYCTVHGQEMTATVTVSASALTVTKLSPKKGPASGGTSVTITGTGFTGATAVKFGATQATSFKVNSPTSVTAVSPAGTPGAVDVRVTTPSGTSAITKKDHFRYKKAKK
jgi:plastocyanin